MKWKFMKHCDLTGREKRSNLQREKGVNEMKRIILFLLIIVMLTPVVIYAEPKWIQFAIMEGNGTADKKPIPIYFDVNSIQTCDLGRGLKAVTVRMKYIKFSIEQRCFPYNPYVMDQSYWQKVIDSASVENVMFCYPTMTYADPEMVRRDPTGFQDIPAGSILEKLYYALTDKGYVVMNSQRVANGRR